MTARPVPPGAPPARARSLFAGASQWSSPAQYAFALGVVGISHLARWALSGWLGERGPFLLAAGAILPLMLLVRPGPLLAAAALAWSGSVYAFLPAQWTVELAVMSACFAAVLALAVAVSWIARKVAPVPDEVVRARAEAALRESDARLRLVMDAAPALIAYLDADLRYQLNNRLYQEWFGLTADEFRGRHIRDVLGAAAYDLVRPHLERALAGEPVTFESEVPYKEGARYVRASYLPDRRADGTVVGIHVFVHDLTTTKRAQEAIADSEARLRIAKAAAGLGIHDYDVRTGTIQWDERTRELWGVPADEPITFELWRESLHPDDRARTLADVEAALRPTGGEYRSQYRIVDRAGRIRWIEATGQVTFAADVPVRLVGTVQDVTERERAATALRERQALLQSLIDHTPAVIYVKDRDGRLRMVNRRFCEVAGREAGEIVGRQDREIFSDPALDPILRNDAQVFAEGRTLTFEETLHLPDGPHVYLSTKTPVEGVGFPGQALLGITVDITDRKRAEEALKDADRRKDEFLAVLAHELRNPLAGIRMASGVIARAKGDPDRVAQMNAIVERQSAQLVRLIDDLLDVSRITRGKFEVRVDRADLAAVLGHAIEGLRGACEDKGLTLAVELPPAPVAINADVFRFAQVVANLLHNACKFTDRGGTITLTAAREGTDAVVRVRDTGIGIARDELPRVFEMFAQVKDARGRSAGGLGIGLSLARSIVEMHGGTLEAHSDGPGRGSEFVVRVPALAPEARSPAPAAEAAPGPSVTSRVLAVDDNQDALEAVATLLRMAGHPVETAESGEAALEKARAYKPEVVLLDIGLPGMDGYEVARRIRAEPWGNRALLIAMTGWGQDKDKRLAHEAGFNAHLTKPVDLAQLGRLLAGGPAPRR
jgi:PAS domain S-box-containing protein